MAVGFPQSAYAYLLPELAAALNALPAQVLDRVEELRLRVGQPVEVVAADQRFFLPEPGVGRSAGGPDGGSGGWLVATPGLMDRMVLLVTGSSFYALEQELGQGYVTLPGGHRAGLCGQAVVEQGRLKTLKHISSINLRFARPVEQAASPLLPYVWQGKTLCHTLLASPPRVGKTTALRDLAVALSEGRGGHRPLHVAIADERGEIAGAREGVPQLPVGSRTDVLTGCPKAQSMMALIRSMSPEVLLTDEIGRQEDAYAIQEALNAGIVVIATAHAASRQELLGRPCTGELLRQGLFQRLILLGRDADGLRAAAVYDQEGALCG